MTLTAESAAEKAVREALEGITPLPWSVYVRERDYGTDNVLEGPTDGVSSDIYSRVDAHAIATVMNAAPALLAEIAAARAEIERLREELTERGACTLCWHSPHANNRCRCGCPDNRRGAFAAEATTGRA